MAKTKGNNRGLASGIPTGSKNARFIHNGQSMSRLSSASNIAGYYDKPNRKHKKYIPVDIACRKTAFTKNNMDKWLNALPFVERCSEIYKNNGGEYYDAQLHEYNKIHKSVKIPNTVFTTITVNHNWRTACHKDSGDFSNGLGNLIVTGKNFTGCYIGFPQFKVCIDVQPGDFLLMDVHQWHCNTEMSFLTSDGFRLSYVMYLLEKMSKCVSKKYIEGDEYILPRGTKLKVVNQKTITN